MVVVGDGYVLVILGGAAQICFFKGKFVVRFVVSVGFFFVDKIC